MRPIVILVLAVLFPVFAGEKALENQDVVRMVVAGRSSREIVEAIETHEARFDLSTEMLSELEIAGVPAVVLDAMRTRQAAMAPPPSPAPPTATVEDGASLRVILESRGNGPAALWFPDRVEEDLARVLRLGPEASERKVTDLAVFVACLTPEHVPDQWRVRSALGRDFVSMPRHELLVLHSGARPVDPKEVPRDVRGSFPEPRKDEPPPGILRLDLPGELSAPLDPKEKHRILVGFAIRAGEDYHLLASAEKADVEVSPGRQIRARILEGKKKAEPVVVELEDPAPPQR